MNAGGMAKACKSKVRVFISELGKRESNTLVTYPRFENNFEKSKIILDGLFLIYIKKSKGPPIGEGPMAYQLVGEVMAHQGDDE